MTYSIKVSANPENSLPFFTRDFDSAEELQEVVKICDNKRRIDWLESLIIPVRTDTLSNFCKDFFLPGLFNQALKANDLALKIVHCILMPIYDIICFPVRVITAIPRYIYNMNHSKESHPFYQYLIRNGVAAKNLNGGYVYLETTGGVPRFESNCRATRGTTFNFMQLPKRVSPERFEWSEHQNLKSS